MAGLQKVTMEIETDDNDGSKRDEIGRHIL